MSNVTAGAVATTQATNVRTRALALMFVNVGVILAIAQTAPRPSGGALLAAIAFWAVVIVLPDVVNRELLLSPGNWVLFLFFMSMAVGPAVMLTDTLLPRLWIITLANWDTSRTDDYLVPASALWAAAFISYALARRLARHRSPVRPSDPRQIPGPWMIIVGVVLVAAGIGGLVAATGSLTAALALRGRHSATVAAFVTGTYRYTVWMEAVPVAATLIWYYAVRRNRLRPTASMALLLALYVPLFPFYLYSSGRARTLLPLVLLLALYSRVCRPVRLRWFLAGMVFLLPLLASWSSYRSGVADVNLTGDSVFDVISGDLSRYDVGVVALAGFREARMPFYLGSTVTPAITSWLPGDLGSRGTEGTGAMAQAMAGTRSWSAPSSYATSMVTESYLNFGVLGVIVGGYLLAVAVTVLDRWAMSPSIARILFAFALALKLPFGSSFVISSSQIIWAVVMPFAAIHLGRLVLGGRSVGPRLSVDARRT